MENYVTPIPEKHRKVKPLSRVHMMDIAKIIRNLPLNDKAKEVIRRRLAEYFGNIDPFFDGTRFRAVATGVLEGDTRTNTHSHLQEE